MHDCIMLGTRNILKYAGGYTLQPKGNMRQVKPQEFVRSRNVSDTLSEHYLNLHLVNGSSLAVIHFVVVYECLIQVQVQLICNVRLIQE